MKSPAQIAKAYVEIALGKCRGKAGVLWVQAMLAGAYVALASFAAHTVSNLFSSPGVARLIAALLFPAGLGMILIGGGELFTGNCMVSLGVWARRVSPGQLVRNWCIVYGGNLCGAVLIAALSAIAQGNDGAFYLVVQSVAVKKASLSLAEAFTRGILCNLLVCAAVWMSYAATSVSGKMLAMYMPVALFVLCGTEHCVANMYYGFVALFAGAIDVAEMLTYCLRNLLPVTLGNIIGGAVLFAGMLWFAYFLPQKNTVPEGNGEEDIA